MTDSTVPSERAGIAEHVDVDVADLVEAPHGVAPDDPALTQQGRRAPIANAPGSKATKTGSRTSGSAARTTASATWIRPARRRSAPVSPSGTT